MTLYNLFSDGNILHIGNKDLTFHLNSYTGPPDKEYYFMLGLNTVFVVYVMYIFSNNF